MKKNCSTCGDYFDAKRSTAKYCSDRCRVQAQRKGAGGTVVAFGVAQSPPAEPRAAREAGPLETAARAELEAVGRAETLAGAQVLALARRLDAAGADETGSSYAALSKELRAALVVAVAGAEQAADPIDELRKQRDRKRAR
jgi:endogenous inhibitor of DNA gyrase (YacG/DUF329 family)